MLFFFLQICLKPFLNTRRIQKDIIITHACFHIKRPTFLSDFKQNWIWSTDFSIDIHTEMMKLKVTFCNCFVNAPKQRFIVGMLPAFSSANLPLLTEFVQQNLLCTQSKQHYIQHISTHIVRHTHLYKTSPQSDLQQHRNWSHIL